MLTAGALLLLSLALPWVMARRVPPPPKSARWVANPELDRLGTVSPEWVREAAYRREGDVR